MVWALTDPSRRHMSKVCLNMPAEQRQTLEEKVLQCNVLKIFVDAFFDGLHLNVF